MKIQFKNPYKIKLNWFIRLYTLTYYRFRKPLSYVFYLYGIIFRRFAFELVKKNVKLFTTGTYKSKRFRVRSTNSQFHSIYFYPNCYEPDVFAAVECLLPENGVFVDIGANWGHHSFIAVAEKNATVYAFEPNKVIFEDLISIRDDLNMSSRVNAYNLGIGSTVSKLELVQNDFESGVASVSESFRSSRLFKKRWPERFVDSITFKTPIVKVVNIVPLDMIISDDVVPNLIKIDAEGAELECLQGMRNVLQNHDVKVLFELHTDRDGSYKEFSDFFENLSYKLYEIVVDEIKQTHNFLPVDFLKPFTQYNLVASKIAFRF